VPKLVKHTLGRYISNWVLPKGLYCFNYHRIGDAKSTLYDPNVFSCDEINFEDQIQYIKKNFTVITSKDIPAILNGAITNKKYALISFDDGYVDNYSKAFPILTKHNVPATFFLATNFINNVETPWWDKIAYLIRHAQVREVQLESWTESIELCKANISNTIKEVLNLVKVNDGNAIEDILVELEQKLQIPSIDLTSTELLFMDWNMIREMHKSGMEFGSQTCSHRIMSHLTLEEQDSEAKISKEIIDKELNTNIEAFAYPVGGPDSFTNDTVEIIKKYYKVSFSFIPGINTSTRLNEFLIERVSVDSNCNSTQLSYTLLKLFIRKIQKNKWK
jgi:peptidoglycan/xylan/chitin deacetylase (PgdA/CDA1 family)